MDRVSQGSYVPQILLFFLKINRRLTIFPSIEVRPTAYDFVLQFPASYTVMSHTPAKDQGQRSQGSEERMETTPYQLLSGSICTRPVHWPFLPYEVVHSCLHFEGLNQPTSKLDCANIIRLYQHESRPPTSRSY